MAQVSKATLSGFTETKRHPKLFHNMMLAITIYWIAAVTVMLCLFGGGCIGLAIMAREGSVRARRTVRQSAPARKPTARRDD